MNFFNKAQKLVTIAHKRYKKPVSQGLKNVFSNLKKGHELGVKKTESVIKKMKEEASEINKTYLESEKKTQVKRPKHHPSSLDGKVVKKPVKNPKIEEKKATIPREHTAGTILEKKQYPNSTLIRIKEDDSGAITKLVRVEKNPSKKVSVFNAYLENLEEGDSVQVIDFIRDNEGSENLGWINWLTVLMPKELDQDDLFDRSFQSEPNTIDSIRTLKEKYKAENRGNVLRFYESLIDYKANSSNIKFEYSEDLEYQEIKEFKRSNEFSSHIDPDFKIQKKEELKDHEAELERQEIALRDFVKNKEFEIYGWERKQELESSVLGQKQFIKGFKKDYFL